MKQSLAEQMLELHFELHSVLSERAHDPLGTRILPLGSSQHTHSSQETQVFPPIYRASKHNA
jgi:hypothetical protein